MKKLAVGLLLGVIALGMARFFATPWESPVHYHANWAILLTGERLDLTADRYMEEVDACVAQGRLLPTQRVHMHDGEHDVVHVHDEGVAWAHLLANLDFVLADDLLILDDGRRFEEGEGSTLKFVVNGFGVGEIGNRLIESGDRLLISFGPETLEHVVETQFSRVAQNAEEYNVRQDPAGCAGAAEPTLWERLRRAFWG